MAMRTTWLQDSNVPYQYHLVAFTQQFGLRGRQEHHSMKIEDLTLKVDSDGVEYLTLAEGVTKTRQSGLHEKHRLVKPNMFASNTSRCSIGPLLIQLLQFGIKVLRWDSINSPMKKWSKIIHSYLLIKKSPITQYEKH